MAEKNRGQLRTAIRDVLSEPVAARWSDPTINEYINSALEALSRALLRTKTATTSVATNTETVSLPADCLVLNGLYWVNANGDVKPIVRQVTDRIPVEEGDDTETGIPGKYWFIDDVIYLRPLPEEAGTVKFEYYYRLPDLENDKDVPALPGLSSYIKAHAVFEAYFDDGDPRYELWKQRRGEELSSWMALEVSNYSTGFRVSGNF